MASVAGSSSTKPETSKNNVIPGASVQKIVPPPSEPSVIPEDPTANVLKLRRKSSASSSSASNTLRSRSLVTQSQIYPNTSPGNNNEYDEDSAVKRRKSSICSSSADATGTAAVSRTNSSRRTSSQYGHEHEPIKMSGYLEKRSKMIGWKRFWFVLDGHLLTYYKSKADYDSLHACSGSINLGLASTVRPLKIRGCKGYPLEITTRTQVYYLRSLEKPILEKWLIALQVTTSAEPRISSPTWADPGVQFYRYSFAPSSNWSLAISTDDISGSLRDLPKNFYLKSSAFSGTGNYGDTLRLGSMKKCQSLASLQQPSFAYGGDGSPKLKLGPRGLEMRSASPTDTTTNTSLSGKGSSGSKRVRQSASMLVLEASTPAAVEFRKELTQKLSAAGGKPFAGPSITKKKSPPSPSPKKHLSSQPDEDPHQYDEIIDFEASYKPSPGDGTVRSSSSSNSKCSETESNANTNNTPSNSLDYETVQVSSSAGPSLWERRLDYYGGGGGTGAGSGTSNRNSLISIEEEDSLRLDRLGTAKSRLISPQQQYYENDEDFNQSTSSLNSRSDSFKKKKGIGGFFQKIFHKKDEAKRKGREGGRDSISSSSDISNRSSGMVITGPVDLKSLLIQNKDKEGDFGGGSTGTLKGKHKKGSVDFGTPSLSTPASTLQKPVFGSQNVFPNNNENVLAELKSKIGQRKRPDEIATNDMDVKRSQSHPKINSAPAEGSCTSEPTAIPAMCTEQGIGTGSPGGGTLLVTVPANRLQEILEAETAAQVQALSQPDGGDEEKENQTPPALAPRSPKLQSKQTTEEYQSKLAKFNRLSAQLNPTFVAALLNNNKPSSTVVNGNGTIASTGIMHHHYVNIGRSNSLSTRVNPRNSDEPPILPPKKRQIGSCVPDKEKHDPPPYDVPRNNRPVSKPGDKCMSDHDSERLTNMSEFYAATEGSSGETQLRGSGNEIRLLRDLTKKNSAPDITFPRKGSAIDEQLLLPIIFNQQENEDEGVVLEPPPYAPPPPPSEDRVLNPSRLAIDDSPPTPTKSIDIDNLDGLSDVSIPTPPNTPSLDSMTSPTFQPFSYPSASVYSDGEKKPMSDLQLKYATINTLVTELETVEETEDDEMIELYDDFPTEMIQSIPTLPAQPIAAGKPEDSEYEDVFPDGAPNEKDAAAGEPLTRRKIIPPSALRIQSVRHSGIDALQTYLYSNESPIDPEEQQDACSAVEKLQLTKPTGKINRLGHSAAITQLQKLVEDKNE